jgi:hypothetical protein
VPAEETNLILSRMCSPLNLDALGSQVRDHDVDAALLDGAQTASAHAQADETLFGFRPKSVALRLFACETVLPVLGPLPVTWQTRDMAKTFEMEALREPRFIPGSVSRGKACG